MSYAKVKGTYDVLPSETKKWQALEKHIRLLFEKYNYQEIRTPLIEHSEVFHRSNEHSDMVTKETYNFTDRSGRALTLRPEGTAGVVRSFIENKLYASQALEKLYYVGPNFRYERPQKGRFRQFMQFGIEALGTSSPYIDAEVIMLAYDVIKSLGLKGVKVKINSLGNNESKHNYYQALKAHFEPHKSTLCSDCQARLEKNPLRILDCKIDKNHEAVLSAPNPFDFLSAYSENYIKTVLSTLNEVKIPYVLAPKLVRGLDYYSETVFEIEADIDGFGAQNVLGGGGRYESLVAELGGPSMGGIGFAFGMERLLLALEAEDVDLVDDSGLDAYVIIFNQSDMPDALVLVHELRNEGLRVDLDFTEKNFKAQLKQSLKEKSMYLLILGENEIKNHMVTVKNTKTETQELIPRRIVVRKIKEYVYHE